MVDSNETLTFSLLKFKKPMTINVDDLMYLGENRKRLNISATQGSQHCVMYTIILIIREGKMVILMKPSF